MSLRIVPSASHPSSTTNTTTKSKSHQPSSLDRGAPSAPGLHDTLRTSLATPSPSQTSQSSRIQSSHPLESRLASWHQTQQSLHHALLRRNFGIAEPLRRGMELHLVRSADSFRPSVLGKPSGVHEEILTGNDSTISWEDVYAGQDGMRLAMDGAGESGQGVVGWHEEMERMVGMGKW